ncbi:MAG: hypothetical protein A2Y40_08410 [Candidatus Margulisbacteria bacterium GWF2_35_9]|nr:MAG: hypothetical protein A2Y40_08410 [Candidatus Margulisbacteria bacterium GWF2_35_9]
MGFFDKGKKDNNEFRSEGTKRRSSGGGRDSYEEKELTTVTCDTCGKSCTVPFRPTAGKPVYCNDCFKKNDSGSRSDRSAYPKRRTGSDSRGRSSDSGSSSRELAQINAKLDRILEMLDQDAE